MFMINKFYGTCFLSHEKYVYVYDIHETYYVFYYTCLPKFRFENDNFKISLIPNQQLNYPKRGVNTTIMGRITKHLKRVTLTL